MSQPKLGRCLAAILLALLSLSVEMPAAGQESDPDEEPTPETIAGSPGRDQLNAVTWNLCESAVDCGHDGSNAVSIRLYESVADAARYPRAVGTTMGDFNIDAHSGGYPGSTLQQFYDYDREAMRCNPINTRFYCPHTFDGDLAHDAGAVCVPILITSW